MIGRTYRQGKEKRLAIDNSQLPRVQSYRCYRELEEVGKEP